MKLGLVASNENAESHLIGLARAAAARGWTCRGFLTDRGVLLLKSAPLIALVQSGALSLSVCEHSWKLICDSAVPDGVVMGGQFQNAELAHNCDRVIAL